MTEIATQYNELIREIDPQLLRRYEKSCQRYLSCDYSTTLAELVDTAKTQLMLGLFIEAVRTRNQIAHFQARALRARDAVPHPIVDSPAASSEDPPEWQKAQVEQAEKEVSMRSAYDPTIFTTNLLFSFVEGGGLHRASQTSNICCR